MNLFKFTLDSHQSMFSRRTEIILEAIMYSCIVIPVVSALYN